MVLPAMPQHRPETALTRQLTILLTQ